MFLCYFSAVHSADFGEIADAVLGDATFLKNIMKRTIRSKMFVFEELARVDNRKRIYILKRVEFPVLAVALKNASEGMREKVFACISEHNTEMLNDEFDVMGRCS